MKAERADQEHEDIRERQNAAAATMLAKQGSPSCGRGKRAFEHVWSHVTWIPEEAVCKLEADATKTVTQSRQSSNGGIVDM